MSIIFGILASVLPNFIFKQVLFKSGVDTPQQVLKHFYWAGVLKFIGLVVVFSLILQWPGLQIEVFLGTFLLSELARWLLLWVRARGR